MSPTRAPLVRHFSKLKDPRRLTHNKKRHKLLDIIVIAVCATLCGIDDFEHMEVWANQRHTWLKKFLELPCGIPSHDTINRIFAKIDPKKFNECFIAWISEVSSICKGEIVALDGKTLRGSIDRASSKSALHMVSAWATESGVVMGQVAVEEKSNEITAIPKLLEVLELAGCLVTIDAIGTQREISEKILQKKADYTLALKGNQATLHADVIAIFEQADLQQMTKSQRFSTLEDKHGRIDIRNYFLISDIGDLKKKHNWPGLASIGMVRSIRANEKGTSIEDRYYINSYKSGIKKFAAAVRGHWGIEALHWQLDVSLFNEDKCRVRRESAPENLAVLRHVAMNLHKRNPTKGSMTTKKMLCMLDPDELLNTLFS